MKNKKSMNFKKFANRRWLDNSFKYAQPWFASLTIYEQIHVRKYCEKFNFMNNMFLSYYDNIVLCWFLFKDTLK